MSEDNFDLVEERKKKFLDFVKNKTVTIYLALLGIIIWIASYIRTRNLPGLKDITTGKWTLGPDLDPFLFLRWAKYLVENGTFIVNDMMRYVPLGFDTSSELKLVTYSISWMHDFLNWFGDYTVEYAAVIMPVIVFALACVAFFFFVREIFKDEYENKHIPNIIATAATFIFAVIPSVLPRTIAGIPEKENLGFLFLFLSFYLFVKSWKQKSIKGALIYSALAGAATALMSHSWGGSIYLFISIALAGLASFLFGSVTKLRFYSYATWLLAATALFLPFTSRYGIVIVLTSVSTGSAFAVLAILLFDHLLYNTKLRIGIIEKYKEKIPRQVLSTIAAIIAAIIILSVLFGPSAATRFFTDPVKALIYPYSDRLSFTVAENRQPFFTDEWRGSWGPIVAGIPLFFWLFFIGSIYLFHKMMSHLEKRERIKLTGAYAVFLLALIFSKYSGNSTFNGTNTISKLFYLGGIALMGLTVLYAYWNSYKKKDDSLSRIDFSYILLFSLFLISIIGGRSAVRLMMVLGPPAAIIASYFVVDLAYKALRKEGSTKLLWQIAGVIVVIALFYTAYTYTQASYYMAGGFVPNSYTQQWQKAMAWVRENTTTNAVFSHWWDYGYWVQSIGERATILDGGNAYPYWDHLIGRHVLTSPSKLDALEYLYSHNVTHLLIDSTDIGKYSAFSNIGSDKNYDRASYIPTIGLDERQTQETSNQTVYFYRAGFGLDEDIVYQTEGNDSKRILIPSSRAGLGAVLLPMTNNSISRPEAIFVDQGQQYKIPLRYVYLKGRLYDFKTGLEAGIFIMPVVQDNGNGGVTINEIGSALYLSRRIVNSNLARLYLFGEEGEGFTLEHSEDDFIVASLKAQGSNVQDFVYFNGMRGPIRIWSVEYPEGIKYHPEYLETEYPREDLYRVKQ